MITKKSIKIIAAAFGLLAATASFAQGAPAPASTDGLTPYAQVRIWAGYVSQSKEVISTTATKSDTDWHSRLTSSRFGVKGKYGDLDGVVELGLAGLSSAGATGAVTTRKIFGVYNINPDMKFMFGQDDAPFTYYSNALANDDLNCGYGNTFSDRDLQLKFSAYGAYIDIMNPITPAITINATYAAADFDILVPRLAAGYEFKNADKSIEFGLGGAFQSSKIDKEAAVLDGKSINAYLLYAHGKVLFGGFHGQLNFGYGQNTANLGLNYRGAFVAAATSTKAAPAATVNPMMSTGAEANAAGDAIKNTKSMEGYIEAGYKVSIMDLSGGVGYVQAKNSNWAKTDAQIVYYAQLSIALIDKRLFVIPTAQYRDFMKGSNGAKQGNETLAGVFVQAVY